MIEAGSDSSTCAGQPGGMNYQADFDPEIRRDYFNRLIDLIGSELRQIFNGRSDSLHNPRVVRGEILTAAFFDLDLAQKIEIGEGFYLGELFYLFFAGRKGRTDISGIKAFDSDSLPFESGGGELVEALLGHGLDVFAIDPVKFIDVEPGVVAKDLRQIKHADDLIQRHHFAISLWGPTEQEKIV